jgi:hypothetical protein
MKKNPYNFEDDFRPTGGSRVTVKLRIKLEKYLGRDGSYDVAGFDRSVSELLRRTPPSVPIELDVASTPPCWWFPAPFCAAHEIQVVGDDGDVIDAWQRFLSGPHTPPDGGLAA